MVRLKYISFGILLLVIWFPFAQMLFPLIRSKPLKGAFVPHDKPAFSDSAWFSGNFQRAYEEYLNDTIGFHQDFIRIRNQIDYSLFYKCHSYDVEVGKNGYLVATWHIDSHLGKMKGRETRVDSMVAMLAQINDTLIKRNKTLIILFAPSRGAFYKELAPAWYDLTSDSESDYQRYTRLLSKTKVRYIDYNKAFLEKKNSSKYPLFTKCGIHWSSYGAALAADSLVKFIEAERKIDLPDIKFTRIEMSKKARGADADLSNALNLIWNIKNDPMAYPTLMFAKKGKEKIKLLTIGDSFFYGIMESKVPDQVFEEYSFWYYNNSIDSNGPNGWKTTKEVLISEEIKKHDVITLIATESTLINFGWDFIDQAWMNLCTPLGARASHYADRLAKDSVLFREIAKRAKKYDRDLNLQVLRDSNLIIGHSKNVK